MAARTALDEVGFVVLETATTSAPTAATISELGGQSTPPDHAAQAQPPGVPSAAPPASTGRLRSHVVRNPTSPDGPPDSEDSARRGALAEAGSAKVVAFEQGCQRHHEVKPPHHKGYDIESRDAARVIVRYIEVKCMSGCWDTRGVGVTYPEFEKAQQLGDKFWLHVVERADQPEARIHQVQDSARKVDQFLYDDGWSEAAESP